MAVHAEPGDSDGILASYYYGGPALVLDAVLTVDAPVVVGAWSTRVDCFGTGELLFTFGRMTSDGVVDVSLSSDYSGTDCACASGRLTGG